MRLQSFNQWYTDQSLSASLIRRLALWHPFSYIFSAKVEAQLERNANTELTDTVQIVLVQKMFSHWSIIALSSSDVVMYPYALVPAFKRFWLVQKHNARKHKNVLFNSTDYSCFQSAVSFGSYTFPLDLLTFIFCIGTLLFNMVFT